LENAFIVAAVAVAFVAAAFVARVNVAFVSNWEESPVFVELAQHLLPG